MNMTLEEYEKAVDSKVEKCCANCLAWEKLEGQKEQPFWGWCRAARGSKFHALTKYIRPVPEHLETTADFLCKAFAPSFEALREVREAMIEEESK